MEYIQGISREQIHLFTESLDNIIDEENPVRFIDAYVEKLDLKKLGFVTPKLITGRPPFNPELLLKMYIYSYLKKIRSSRKIEETCKINVEMMWLTQKLTPDFKTIADFRKDNKEGIKNIFKEFLKLCNKLKLLSFKCVAIDGTKIRAQNSLNNIYKRNEIEKIEKAIEEKIKQYIAELDENDEKEKDDFEFLSINISEKIKKLKKNKDKIKTIKQIFEDNPELEVYFANDPDSRFQKDNGRTNPGYNCQSAVDEKNKLIIANDITNKNQDAQQLGNMKEKLNETKDTLKVKEKTVIVTDAGYYSEKEIIEAITDENVDVYIPHPRDVKTKERQGKEKKNIVPTKGYKKDDFKYDETKDCLICPEGKKLSRKHYGLNKRGIKNIKYFCDDYKDCTSRKLCSTSKYGRSVEVSVNMKIMNSFREKVNSEVGKQIVKKRKELAEHPFGTIKRTWGYRYFMQKGQVKVQSEFSFISFIYNLRRVLNMVPMNKLFEAIN